MTPEEEEERQTKGLDITHNKLERRPHSPPRRDLRLPKRQEFEFGEFIGYHVLNTEVVDDATTRFFYVGIPVRFRPGRVAETEGVAGVGNRCRYCGGIGVAKGR